MCLQYENIIDGEKSYEMEIEFKQHNIFLLLFICAYKAWVISPPCPTPSLTTHSAPSLSPYPLKTQQKLFCPYL
jgi:hypothetical protein